MAQHKALSNKPQKLVLDERLTDTESQFVAGPIGLRDHREFWSTEKYRRYRLGELAADSFDVLVRYDDDTGLD